MITRRFVKGLAASKKNDAKELNVVSVFDELVDVPKNLVRGLPDTPSAFQALPRFAPKPGTRKLIGMIGVILSSMCLIMVGYLMVGFAGYFAYPVGVASNVLNSFPDKTDVLVARAVVGTVVMCHYPLNHHPARHAWEDVIEVFGGSRPPKWVSTVGTVFFVTVTTNVALVVRDLGAVLHIIGGTAACFMIFLIPGLLLINAAVVKNAREQLDYWIEDVSVHGDSSAGHTRIPLLQRTADHGIKKSGIIYSPRKSFFAGWVLVGLSAGVFAITLVTTFVHE